MDIDAEQLIQNAIRDGIRDGVKKALEGYNSPLEKLVQAAIMESSTKLKDVMTEAITNCIADADFRAKLIHGTQQKLATTLVQRFGGEMEKQINVLKSDPTTRARITLAIENIVSGKQ